MDIGYFLKLMTDKNASDMFLSTGAPVYIKVEGKLYPLGNTGLPPGMVKKIAYSLMDEGQVPQFERDLALSKRVSLADWESRPALDKVLDALWGLLGSQL
jgi:twitching motility protein PilU